MVRNDIKLAAKIITNLDNKWGLWQKDKSDHSIGKFYPPFTSKFLNDESSVKPNTSEGLQFSSGGFGHLIFLRVESLGSFSGRGLDLVWFLVKTKN